MEDLVTLTTKMCAKDVKSWYLFAYSVIWCILSFIYFIVKSFVISLTDFF